MQQEYEYWQQYPPCVEKFWPDFASRGGPIQDLTSEDFYQGQPNRRAHFVAMTSSPLSNDTNSFEPLMTTHQSDLTEGKINLLSGDESKAYHISPTEMTSISNSSVADTSQQISNLTNYIQDHQLTSDETGGTLEASTDLVGNFAAAAAAAAASYSYNLPSNYYDLGSGSVPSLTLSEAAAAGVTLTAAAACLGGSGAGGPVVSSEGVGITPVRTDPSTAGGLLSPNNTVVTELEPPPPLASFSSIQPTAANATAAGQLLQCNGTTYFVPSTGVSAAVDSTALLANISSNLRSVSPYTAAAAITSSASAVNVFGTNAQTTLAPTNGVAGNTIVNQLYDQATTRSTVNGQADTCSNNNNTDSNGQPYATRVAPVTISWLINNYETAEGVSLPRSTLYTQYQKHCAETRQEPVNAASFGKLIRSVFLGLRTRRIGTRGNSKYHYYGIRVKPSSVLQLSYSAEEPQHQPEPQTLVNGKTQLPKKRSSGQNDAEKTHLPKLTLAPAPQLPEHLRQYLGNALPDPSLDHCPSIDIKDGLIPSKEMMFVFQAAYNKHCQNIHDAVFEMKLSSTEGILMDFWSFARNGPNDGKRDNFTEILGFSAVQAFIMQADCLCYQKIVDFLMPKVLSPIPSPLTQLIRNFAKNIETWMKSAIQGPSQSFLSVKIRAAKVLGQTLRRYTGLNHLAQAARAVLQSPAQIVQMKTDFGRVDFENVHSQASWVTHCEWKQVSDIHQSFVTAMSAPEATLEKWADWLEQVLNDTLDPHVDGPYLNRAADDFLLKWSFYGSMVIRDLTLRSAASFGSFHLIRLLFDEYMFYLVESKLANARKVSKMALLVGGSCVDDKEYAAADNQGLNNNEEDNKKYFATKRSLDISMDSDDGGLKPDSKRKFSLSDEDEEVDEEVDEEDEADDES